jgi:hypothetical protein
MSNFKVGEIVICTNSREKWRYKDTKKREPQSPDKDEECEIIAFDKDGFLGLRGYTVGYFDPAHFRKKTPLSMTFKVKYEDMKEKQELILMN